MTDENIRALVQAIDPVSILPEKATESGRDNALSTVFRSRERVYFTGDPCGPGGRPAGTPGSAHLLLGSDLLSSVAFSTSARLASIPINIEPLDNTNCNHRRLAGWSHMLLKYYWAEIAFQVALDWQTQDNGAFIRLWVTVSRADHWSRQRFPAPTTTCMPPACGPWIPKNVPGPVTRPFPSSTCTSH